MTPAEARALIGVDEHAPWEVIRVRYRERIRLVHPDLTGGSGAEAARVNVAFATLVRARRAGSEPAPVDTTPGETGAAVRPLSADIRLVDGDTLLIAAPPDETFRRVLAGLDLIGEVSYVDRSGPIAEAIVVLDDGSSHSLVVSFQGRGLTTEVFATLESIETVATAVPEQVLRTLARFIPPA